MRTLPTSIRNLASFRQRRRLLALLIAVTLVAVNYNAAKSSAGPVMNESTVVLETAGAPFLPGTFQIINNGPGTQTDPHVHCGIASYTSAVSQEDNTVHYQNLSTGADNIIPGNELDLFSDISGSHIVFTEIDFTDERVVIFDTLSQIRTVVPRFEWTHPAVGRAKPSIGGNLVAFQVPDFSISWNTNEIGLYDLSSGTLTQLTNDSLNNQNVSVSPNGDALVWQKCQLNDSGCDIYAALQTSPGVFTMRALSSMEVVDGSPDTNGELAVYILNKNSENDVYYQPLVDGAEVRLSIPGEQRHATISGNLIAFESEVQTGYEIFVYDIATSNLFQVTSTPRTWDFRGDESFSEINVCNGVGHIVYSLPGDGGLDAYAFTFQPPSGTESQINDLISLVRSFNLPHGTTNSLIVKLQAALAAFEASDTATACNLLSAFVNECQAQSGKKLTPDQSAQLINSANQIKTDLGCQ